MTAAAPERTALLFLALRGGVDAADVAREAAPAVGARAAFARLADDPFRDFSRGMRGYELVLELGADAVAGLPERAAVLAARAADAMHLDLCAALVGDEHVFVPGGPTAIRYQYLMRRRAGLSHADYLAHYGTHHAAIGTRTGGKRGYSQLHADPAASERLAAAAGFGLWRFDSVSRLWLDTIRGFLEASARDGSGAEAVADEEHFVDRESSVMFASRPLSL